MTNYTGKIILGLYDFYELNRIVSGEDPYTYGERRILYTKFSRNYPSKYSSLLSFTYPDDMTMTIDVMPSYNDVDDIKIFISEIAKEQEEKNRKNPMAAHEIQKYPLPHIVYKLISTDGSTIFIETKDMETFRRNDFSIEIDGNKYSLIIDYRDY